MIWDFPFLGPRDAIHIATALQVQADAIEHYDNDFARVAKEVSERQTAGLPACRRFTRLTNAFSKKLENLAAAPGAPLRPLQSGPHPPVAADHARDGGRGDGAGVGKADLLAA